MTPSQETKDSMAHVTRMLLLGSGAMLLMASIYAMSKSHNVKNTVLVPFMKWVVALSGVIVGLGAFKFLIERLVSGRALKYEAQEPVAENQVRTAMYDFAYEHIIRYETDTELDERKEDVRYNSEADDIGAEALLATIACAFVASSNADKRDLVSTFTAVMGALPKVERGVLTLTRASQWILRCLPVAFQTALMKTFGLSLGLDCSEPLADAVITINNLLAEFDRNQTVIADGNYRTSVDRVHAQFIKLFNDEFITLGTRRSTSKIVSQAKADIGKLMTLVAKASVAGDSIPKPYGLVLSGNSGIGKTYLIQAIAAALYPHLTLQQALYTIPMDPTDFWTGYMQQPIVLIDDYGTVLSKELVNMILQFMSNNATPTRQADIASKGMPFNSKLVILTSNLRLDTSVPGITNMEALTNRFEDQDGINCDVKLGACYKRWNGQRKLDKDKLMAKDELYRNRFEHLDFHYARLKHKFSDLIRDLNNGIARAETAYFEGQRLAAGIRKFYADNIDELKEAYKDVCENGTQCTREKCRFRHPERMCPSGTTCVNKRCTLLHRKPHHEIKYEEGETTERNPWKRVGRSFLEPEGTPLWRTLPIVSKATETELGGAIITVMPESDDSVMESGGITIPTDQDAKHDQNAQPVKKSDALSIMNQQEITYRQMAARPTIIATFNWGTYHPLNSLLWESSVPFGLIAGQNGDGFGKFLFNRPHKVKLNFLVQGNQFYNGRLIAFFVPLTASSALDKLQ